MGEKGRGKRCIGRTRIQMCAEGREVATSVGMGNFVKIWEETLALFIYSAAWVMVENRCKPIERVNAWI